MLVRIGFLSPETKKISSRRGQQKRTSKVIQCLIVELERSLLIQENSILSSELKNKITAKPHRANLLNQCMVEQVRMFSFYLKNTLELKEAKFIKANEVPQ